MKKLMIIALSSIALSIIIVIQLYKTTDIKWVDNIVESSSEILNYKPEMVVEKKKRKENEEKRLITEINTEQKDGLKSTPDTVMTVQPDTIATKISFASVEKKRRKIFNTFVEEKKQVIVDSAIKAPEVKPKRKLFNSSIEHSSERPVAINPSISFFKAKVNGSQKFKDEQEVIFRTAEKVNIGSLNLPENYVFSAKANVFDGKIYFIIKAISNVEVKGENYNQEQKGLPLTSELKFGSSYVVSDGYQVQFGIQL